MRLNYEGVGWFQHHWRNPPAPFNPDFDSKAEARYAKVSRSMQDDGFHASHTREECAAEWRRRYEIAAAGGAPQAA